MSKILMVADVHLGVQNRLADSVWALRVVDEYAQRHDVTDIIGLGDLHHDRLTVGLDVLCASYDYFREAKRRGRHWIWIPGNHDMFQKHSWDINSIKPLSELVTFIDGVKVIKIDDVRFWTLPFIHLESSYMRVLGEIEKKHRDGDVLLTHIGTFGAVKNICFLLKDWSIVSFRDSPFTQVFTGHFHVPQQVGHNVTYPGSLIPFKSDEGDCRHGFIEYDLETRDYKFLDIWELGRDYFPDERPPPNYYTVPVGSIDHVGAIIGNNIIRLADDGSTSPHDRADIEQHLLSRGAAVVRWVNIVREEEEADVAAGNHISFDNAFDEWLKIDSDNLKGYDVDLLRQENSEVVRLADDSYDAGDDRNSL